MPRIKMVIEGQDGGLVPKIVDLDEDHEEEDPSAISDALVNWIQEDEVILTLGDTITITLVE